MLNHGQCLQTKKLKLERHNYKSILFGKFFVKLTSKSRKHNFRKACLCLLSLLAFYSQSRFFPSLFPPATSNLKQKARTVTENVKKTGQMKESKANSIAQILSPVDLVCLSAPYIAKENWLRAKLLNIPSTKWFFKHLQETAFQASLRNCINCVHCDDHFFIFRNVIVTTLFPSPWTIGNFRASSSVTVFKALPTIQLLVTRLEVYIQPTRAMMSRLQRNDNAKRAMSANWAAVLSVIIVKNIIPELNTGCFYLIFELRMYGNAKLFSAQNHV